MPNAAERETEIGASRISFRKWSLNWAWKNESAPGQHRPGKGLGPI